MGIKGYTTIALPNELTNEIDELIKEKKLGYTTRPDFIKEAIRQRIIEIKNASKKHKNNS